MVRVKRLELLSLAAPDPKSGVSTNFTIPALGLFPNYRGLEHKTFYKSSNF